METAMHTFVAVRPFAAGTKVPVKHAQLPATTCVRRAPVTASLGKRDGGEPQRKIGAGAAIALAAVMPFASCCMGANKAVAADIASVYVRPPPPPPAAVQQDTTPPCCFFFAPCCRAPSVSRQHHLLLRESC